jgi:hypothetical protein
MSRCRESVKGLNSVRELERLVDCSGELDRRLELSSDCYFCKGTRKQGFLVSNELDEQDYLTGFIEAAI